MLTEAEKNLKSLQDAYQYELDVVKKQKQSLQDAVSDGEAAQYEIWKDLKGVEEYPSVSVHGLGRMIGISQEYSGDNVDVFPLRPSVLFKGTWTWSRPSAFPNSCVGIPSCA